MSDELDDYLREQRESPEFRAAYEADLRRIRRAYPGYRGRAYGREHRRRALARARRKRRR